MGGGSLYWDLSNLDGVSAGLVGSPFASDNVKTSPVGTGAGSGTCETINCAANQICTDAYQLPADSKTRWCPEALGTFWVDLCMPDAQFNKRDTIFNA